MDIQSKCPVSQLNLKYPKTVTVQIILEDINVAV